MQLGVISVAACIPAVERAGHPIRRLFESNLQYGAPVLIVGRQGDPMGNVHVTQSQVIDVPACNP